MSHRNRKETLIFRRKVLVLPCSTCLQLDLVQVRRTTAHVILELLASCVSQYAIMCFSLFLQMSNFNSQVYIFLKFCLLFCILIVPNKVKIWFRFGFWFRNRFEEASRFPWIKNLVTPPRKGANANGNIVKKKKKN